MSNSAGGHAQKESFATTHWSLVIAAGQSSPDSRRALESLCAAYWYPLYAYARRRVGDVNEAQDLTQSFFAALLEKNYVAEATPSRGRFRAFLLTALRHFMSKEWAKARAQKRGGGRFRLSLDFASADSRYDFEPSSNLTAEQWYDRQWAVTLLDQTIKKLEEEFRDAGKAAQFEQLKPFVIGEYAGAGYAEAAAQLNISPAAAKMAASRMRRRFRRILRQEIAQTVSDPSEIDDEIRQLFEILKL